MFYSAITATFSSAHALRNYRGKCERLHGHNWRVEVVVGCEELDGAGMGIDFTILRERTGNLIGDLDHRYLNDLAPFREINPSSELIAKYLFEELSASINDDRIKVRSIKVWESDCCWAKYETGCC